MSSLRPVALVLAATLVAGAAAATDRDQLVFHAETLEGEVVWSRQPDREVNPASVVKVGTSLWALDELGPGHRYVTEIGFRGRWRPGEATLDGDLVVRGHGDPDLHGENAMLIARALGDLGITRVSGRLVVTGNLWFGWEHGEAGRQPDAARRGPTMARRLRDALDPRRWNRSLESSWRALCDRRGWDRSDPPALRLSDAVAYEPTVTATPLLEHRSGPLPDILRRFNVYSNNDIVRIADPLGGPDALARHLSSSLRLPASAVRLQSASGELQNRMTPRTVVAMLRRFRTRLAELGIDHRHVLPVLGCDDGPSRRMFPRVVSGPAATAVTVKTGTLSTTDGGVAVLAGIFTAADGREVLFCVAAQRAGGNLRRWRLIEQDWLLDLIGSVGGARPETCGPPLPYSDTTARVAPVLRTAEARRTSDHDCTGQSAPTGP